MAQGLRFLLFPERKDCAGIESAFLKYAQGFVASSNAPERLKSSTATPAFSSAASTGANLSWSSAT
jgi:hypothetical protein